MMRKINSLVIFYFFCLILDIKKVDVQRTYSSSMQPTRYGKEQLKSRTKAPAYSEELKSFPQYDSRTPATSKPQCTNIKCSQSERRRRVQMSSTTTKPASMKYKALKLSALAKNETVKFPKKMTKFSRMFDPTATGEDSGFIPITKPYGVKTTPRTANRRARHKTTEELVVKESRTSPNILGNGNFEILRGGIYSEDESNEIPEGRRMSRGYSSYAVPRFQQFPFNVRNFHFPSFYQDRHQLPTHPMFFPRAAY